MAIPQKLSRFIDARFNRPGGHWYFTKAFTLKPESLAQIVGFHKSLKSLVIDTGSKWDTPMQTTFSNEVAGRTVNPAWGRELKVFFGLLGTAWVERNKQLILTEVGKALIETDTPYPLIESQVRKYQISNPSVRNKTAGIALIPHHALLKVLLNLEGPCLSKRELVVFVSHIYNSERDLEYVCSLIESYRKMRKPDQDKLWSSLDTRKKKDLSEFWSYAGQFLSFPRYLKYANASIQIADTTGAKRALRWYESGNAQHIEFDTEKDWFSHYGSLFAEPTAQEAIHYYRKIRNLDRARVVFRQALSSGHVSPRETDLEFYCRIQGEAQLEDWLEYNLDRLEPDLIFLERQYETVDAGRLDILARDSHGNYVVVELKRDMANDKALGQLLRYMGWVRMNLVVNSEVRGYVVGDEIDEGLIYATLAHDTIDRICKTRSYAQLQVRLETHRTTKDCSAIVVDLLTGS